jgi:Phosphatidylinositol-glycan biosynthesis class S protein
MAGTRLWVQSIFVVEFFASLWIAVYIGLLHNNPDDPLSIVLFPPPGRTFLKNHALHQYDHHQHQHHHVDGAHNVKDESFFPDVKQLPLVAATVAVTTATRTGSATSAFWEAVLQTIKLPNDYILINPKVNDNTKSDEESSTVSALLCRDPSLLVQQQQQQQKNHDHAVDLYICHDDFQDYNDSTTHQDHSQMNHSRVLVRSGTLFFYPLQSISTSSLDESSSSQEQHVAAAAEALNSIYPTTASASCHDIPIHFKLLLDMTTITPQEESTMDDFDSRNQVSPGDWKVWMDALNLALTKRQHGSIFSFRPRLTFSVELVSMNLAAAATRRETTTTTSTTASHSGMDQVEENNKGNTESSSSSWNQTAVVSSTSTTTIRHEIALDQLVQSTADLFGKHGHDEDDPFIAYFYISNLPEPLVVVVADDDRDDDDVASQTVALSNRVIWRILDSVGSINAQQDKTDSDNVDGGLLEQKEAALALDQVMDFMTRSCLGIETTAATAWDTDGSFPHFYQSILFQRAVQELYERAVMAIQTQRHFVLSTSNRVPIREHHVAVWQRAVDNIFHAIHVLQKMQQQHETNSSESMMIMTRRRRLEVLDCLQQAIRLMEQMRRNPDFIDRIDFPLEQYAAIFSPLALPLAIPLLVGLIREYKRYREKQRKKDASTIAPSPPSSENDTSIKKD